MDDNIKQALAGLVDDLVGRGVDRQVAARLACEKPEECRRQLDALAAREGEVMQPAAFLVYAIEHGIKLPVGSERREASQESPRAASSLENHQNDVAECFEGLGFRFPSLQSAEGLRPWNPGVLDRWASTSGREPAAVHAARFVLGCYDAGYAWTCGRFDFFEAFATWTHGDDLAFLDCIREYWS